MTLRRREFLKLGAATAGSVSAATLSPSEARPAAPTTDGCKAMLYDATKCIGCRACQTACRLGFDMEPSINGDGLYDEPNDLSTSCPTIIRQYQDEQGEEWSFVKRQCMHCLDPACASACLVNALERDDCGAVTYDVDKCIGCRYCMIACPFEVPTFEYEKAVPSIVKCPFCFDLVSQGKAPRCVEACPTGAITFGDRDELLEDARSRIYSEPNRYVHHVYGEHEAGGTAALYIAGISFDKLGFPKGLSNKSIPDLTKGFLNSVPLVIILWAAFGTALHWFTQRRDELAEHEVARADREEGGS